MANGQWNHLRSVVEEPQASEAIDAARSQYARFDHAWDGLVWLLARSAEKLGIAPSTGDTSLRLYVQAGDVDADAPEIWVIFKVEPETIAILRVNFVKADDEELDDDTVG